MRRVQRIFAVMAAAVVAALIVACETDVAAPAGTGVSAAETEMREYEAVPRLESAWSGVDMFGFTRRRTMIDPETGVYYFVVYNSTDGGVGICVAVDADGRPLIKGGREKEE